MMAEARLKKVMALQKRYIVMKVELCGNGWSEMGIRVEGDVKNRKIESRKLLM